MQWPLQPRLKTFAVCRKYCSRGLIENGSGCVEQTGSGFPSVPNRTMLFVVPLFPISSTKNSDVIYIPRLKDIDTISSLSAKLDAAWLDVWFSMSECLVASPHHHDQKYL